MTGRGDDLFAVNPPPTTTTNEANVVEDGTERLRDKNDVSERLTSMMYQLDQHAARQHHQEARNNNNVRKEQVEITGLELLLQDGCNINHDLQGDCNLGHEEEDYLDDLSLSYEALALYSFDDNNFQSMTSITNDSIELTRRRQQHLKPRSKLSQFSSLGRSVSFDDSLSFESCSNLVKLGHDSAGSSRAFIVDPTITCCRMRLKEYQ